MAKTKENTPEDGGTPPGQVKNRRLNTLQDLRRLLAEVINQCRRGEITESRARVIAYLASVLSSVIKDGDLETRVEALEKLMEAEQD
jgi:hypothetical protein